MRRVRIVERPGETYTYAAVDRETGEVPLQLADRAALIALCERLGWAVHEEKREDKPREERQRMVNATALIADAEWAGPPSIPAQGHARESCLGGTVRPAPLIRGTSLKRANRPDRNVVNFCDLLARPHYCEISSRCSPYARYSTVRFWPSTKPRRRSSSKKAMFSGASRGRASKQPRRYVCCRAIAANDNRADDKHD